MRDIPPDSLIARLIAAKICTVADVQRARGLVRRMTRDLPVFDTVWVDALTQQKALTPFQSRWLETSSPERLVAGGYILRDGFGAGASSQTFLANGPDRRSVVLKQLSIPAANADAVELRLQLLMERSRNVTSPHLAAPTSLVKADERLFVVSRHVPGLNLSELLIRRGRFPDGVVLSIADQLLAALSAWHATGSAHGDVRLTKLRLTDRGQIVLVDCGLAPTLAPEILVHAVHSPEAADVIAPERIGTNLPATAATDLYAAGCVLWQLLTGRPPHPTADPLSKLAAHRTHRIADVRELAPETPAQLAELLTRLTSPDPQERSNSADAARRSLRLRGRSRSATLRNFRRQFDTAVPHLAARTPSRRRTGTWLATAAVLCGAATVLLSDRGLRTELLDVAQRSWSQSVSAKSQQNDATEDVAASPDAGRPLRIPRPDAEGVITLTERGPYEIRKISQVGPLTVRAGDNVRPQIVIDGDAWSLTAQQIVLSGVDILWNGETAPIGPESLVRLKSQRFAIADCRFIGPTNADGEEPEFAAIAWESLDARDPQAGVLEIEQAVFHGAMQALRCLAAPRQVTWRNVLKTEPGGAIAVDQTSSARGLHVVIDSVTLRDTGPLVSCAGPLAEVASASLLEIVAENSVLSLAKDAALVALRGPKARDDWADAIRFAGDGCLVPPGAGLLATVDPQRGVASILESDQLQFDGLFTDEFEFAGPVSGNPTDSQLAKTQAPRRSESLPGIRAELLP